MKLIRLTTIEGRAIAIAPSEIVSIEKGGSMEGWNYGYHFKGTPTKVILKQLTYSVEEDFDTVRKLIEGANNE